MEVRFYKRSIKDLKSLSGDKKAEDVLKNAVKKIGSLNLKKSLQTREIAVLQGVSNQIKNILKQYDYLPNVFEYRKFPKPFLFRIIFVAKKDTDYIILMAIVPHRRMNSQNSFNKMLEKRVKELFSP